MCTPENLRPMCSCPHLVLSRVRRLGVPLVVVAAAVAGGVAGVNYGWVVAVVAWAGVMVTAAVVSRAGGLWMVRRTHLPVPDGPRQAEEHRREPRVEDEQAEPDREPQHPVRPFGWPVDGQDGWRGGDKSVRIAQQDSAYRAGAVDAASAAGQAYRSRSE